jgi:Protein of unknown function (DUF4038)/Putative collagen-binding domain of a collagenase
MKWPMFFFALLIAARTTAGPAYPLKIAPGQRYLVDKNGIPFYMVGDSPQTIMVQVSTNDLETYLADRAARGFNALWVYPVDKVDQTGAPDNYYGNAPFDGADFTNEDAAYWALVDYEVNRIGAYGMVAVMDPGFVGLGASGGYFGSYASSSDATMIAYGAFLGNRYKNYSNIIWSLGGDADPNVPGLFGKLQDIAVGILSNAPDQLITVEASRFLSAGGVAPASGYSSMDAALVAYGTIPSWLTLNWVYKPYAAAQAGSATEYWRPGALPALMGEDWYEGEHSMTPLQLREESYWECLSGCNLGRIFGNDAIWTMGGPQETMGATWQSQLSSPGSVAEAVLGRLFESREFWLLVPDTSNSVLIAGYQSGTTLAVDAKTSDNHTVVAYIPTQQAVTIAMTNVSGSTASAWWYNPTNGTATSVGSFSTTGTQIFTPPDTNDWVLVLDDASQNYPPPGVSSTQKTNSLSIQAMGGDMFQLTVAGIPGQMYTIQFSTNLSAGWQALASNTADSSGTITLDVTATSSSVFYRFWH